MYSAHLLAETERNLRALDYLHDASVRPFAYDGKHVDIIVETRDVWSLQPGISYSRQGGVNEGSVEIEEQNLLGRGKDLSLSWSHQVERDSVLLRWRDPNVFQSRWRSDLAYSMNDDGRLRFIDVERPFYALDTRWSAGGTLFDFTRVDPRYDLGHIVDEFKRDQSIRGAARRLVGRARQRPGAGAGWRAFVTTTTISPMPRTSPRLCHCRRIASSSIPGSASPRSRIASSRQKISTRSGAPRTWNSAPPTLCSSAWPAAGVGSDRDALIVGGALQQRILLGARADACF